MSTVSPTIGPGAAEALWAQGSTLVPLCWCGCGKPARKRSQYAFGHTPRNEVRRCRCGCMMPAPRQKLYVVGHAVSRQRAMNRRAFREQLQRIPRSYLGHLASTCLINEVQQETDKIIAGRRKAKCSTQRTRRRQR